MLRHTASLRIVMLCCVMSCYLTLSLLFSLFKYNIVPFYAVLYDIIQCYVRPCHVCAMSARRLVAKSAAEKPRRGAPERAGRSPSPRSLRPRGAPKLCPLSLLMKSSCLSDGVPPCSTPREAMGRSRRVSSSFAPS